MIMAVILRNGVIAEPFPGFRTNTQVLCYVCATKMQKWCLTSDKCQLLTANVDSGRRRSIVESCPRTKFADQGLIFLHKADNNAVKWLEEVAT